MHPLCSLFHSHNHHPRLLIASVLILFFEVWFLSGVSVAQQSRTLQHGGLTRNYLVYTPPGHQLADSLPLVLVLHGFSQTHTGIMNGTQFNALAAVERFVIAYPAGINNAWNTNTGLPGGSTADDVGFLSLLVDCMQVQYGISRRNVFSCGFSAGGYMSYRLACERPERFRAVASVSGTMTSAMLNACFPSLPVSVMHIHGTADAVVAYNGGFGGVSVQNCLDLWKNRNGCGNATTTNLPDLANDGSSVSLLNYGFCSSTKKLVHYRVNSGGHTWPGAPTNFGLGNLNRDIQANQLIWDFFNGERLLTDTFNLNISPALVCRGDTVRIALTHDSLMALQSLQLQLRWTTDSIDYLGWESVHPLSVGLVPVTNNPNGTWSLQSNSLLPASILPPDTLGFLLLRVRGSSMLQLDTGVNAPSIVALGGASVVVQSGSAYIQTRATGCSQIEAQVLYASAAFSPLSGCAVVLNNQQGVFYARDTADAQAWTRWLDHPFGRFTLSASPPFPWGGVNATDALQVSRAYSGLLQLSPLALRAADVNLSATLNATDALQISRRITAQTQSFAAGDFVWIDSIYDAGLSGRLRINYHILCAGDVNASYIPPILTPLPRIDSLYAVGTGFRAVVGYSSLGTGVYRQGLCWSNQPLPSLSDCLVVSGRGAQAFNLLINGPFFGRRYVRAFAQNSLGVHYSAPREVRFVAVTDTDGHEYSSVFVGGLEWMGENLRVTRFRNGVSIPLLSSNTSWQQATSAGRSAYANDTAWVAQYGWLYNGYAATDARGICPTAWRLPTDAEFTNLCLALGGTHLAGGSLKASWGWQTPNTGANGSSGWNGLPGGQRNMSGNFLYRSYGGYWWSSTAPAADQLWMRDLSYSDTSVARFAAGRRFGFSVRCVR